MQFMKASKPASTDTVANSGPTGGTISTQVLMIHADKACDNLKDGVHLSIENPYNII